MDPSEPRWLTNSSFSPPALRRQDYLFQSDRLPYCHDQIPVYDFSLQSHGKRRRRRLVNEQHAKHQHSVSDGALSYYESPQDNVHSSHWTPPAAGFGVEFPDSTGGMRPDNYVLLECSKECFAGGASPISNIVDSTSPPPESGGWAPTNKQSAFTFHNTPGRLSFISKPVYPLIYRNPISDIHAMAESSGSKTYMAAENKNSPACSDHATCSGTKFQKALSIFCRVDASPDPSSSSKREGFRWSNASSHNFGFEGDAVDVELISPLNVRTSNSSAGDQKCGLCGKLLWQRSPWSSRLVRNGDMPVVGVLPCRHVFHAECLEETTRSKVNEPPCPLCLKSDISELAIPFSEPLQAALRSARRREMVAMEDEQDSGGLLAREGRSLKILHHRRSSMKNHFSSYLTLHGKMLKSSFGCWQR